VLHSREVADDRRIPPGIDASPQLTVLQGVARLEVLYGVLEMPSRWLIDVDFVAVDVELDPALESFGFGVDRMNIRTRIDPHPGPVREDPVTLHTAEVTGFGQARAFLGVLKVAIARPNTSWKSARLSVDSV
jgi:hypothetical protein